MANGAGTVDGIQKNARLLGLCLLAIVVLIAWNTGTMPVGFKKDALEVLPSTLGYLMLASLFVERAIEVFLSAWRSGEADHRDTEIKQANAEIETIKKAIADGTVAQADRDRLAQLTDDLKAKEADRIMYKANSRVIAQWMGLFIGFLVALVGLRLLGALLDVSSLDGRHKNMFIIVDVIVTGAVLAGGSDAINRIMKLYNSATQLQPKQG